MAVDSSGDVYLTGYTSARDFPTTSGSLNTTFNTRSIYEAFVTKLNPAGSSLVFSTLLGGSYWDQAGDIALDGSNNVIVAGITRSTDFPTTTGAYQSKLTTNNGALFLSKLASDGKSLLFSTYLSGSGSENLGGVAVDTTGNVYVTGYTNSTDFPTTPGVYNRVFNTSAGWNGVITKLSSDGTSLQYSTFLSGSGANYLRSIAVDSAGNAYITGQSQALNFPTTKGAYQTANYTYNSAFVTKINASGSGLLYSTFVGCPTSNSGSNQGLKIAVDSAGNAYILGTTTCADFPVSSDAFQATRKSPKGSSIGFVSEIDSSGATLKYSTYFGSSYAYGEYPDAMALDPGNGLYLAGYTSAVDFPITSGALQDTNKTGSNNTGFISKFAFSGQSAVAIPSFSPIEGTYSSTQSVAISDSTPNSIIYYTTDGTTPTTSSTQYSGTIAVSQNTTIKAIATATGYTQSTVASATYKIMAAAPTFSPAGGPYTSSQNVTLSDTTPGATIYYTIDGTTPTASSARYTSSISVSTSLTIQAIAVAVGYANSGVGVASYTINTTAQSTPTVTVTPAASTITTAQNLQVTIKVTGSGTVPTGSVLLTSYGYTSASASLSGGSVTVSVPAGSLAIGIDTLNAAYTPDSSSASAYKSATGTATITVTKAVVAPTITVTPSSSSITTAQPLTVVVGVVGGTGNPTPTGSVNLSSGSYSSAATTLSSGTASITIPAGSLTVGSDTLTATYTPDSSGASSYSGSSGTASITVTSAMASSFNISGTSVTFKAGATQGNTSTITITPGGGFTGTVALSAAVTSSPSGATHLPTMSFGAASSVNITGISAGTSTLTITTTASTSASLVHPGKNGIPWRTATGISLAGIFLFILIPRQRSWRNSMGALLVLGVVLTAMAGCGGTGTKSGGTTGTTGTTPGTYTITVIGTSGSSSSAGVITLTVQ
jgi:Beta-propeller repeat.